VAKVTLVVPDIECEHCEHAINEALGPVPGVRTVKVDIDAHKVDLDYDDAQLSLEKVKEILAEEEYPVEAVV